MSGSVTTRTADAQQAAEELLAAMATVRRRLRRFRSRPVELSELTGAQAELVRLLRRRPGISIADAARELDLAPNTVSTLVRGLSEAGVIQRTVDVRDRRVARLDLDPDVRRRVDAWKDRRADAVAQALRILTADQRASLVAAIPVIARVADALEEDE